ncbi:MAG: hypothetical protein WC764_01800 [Candidatus Paceibacterota bacterium]|jgi:hypothetical protein
MKKYTLYILCAMLLPLTASAQMYNPTMDSQKAQVQYILNLVQSLPSDTNEQLTQKIQLLQQALQLQLQVNNASYTNSQSGTTNYPPMTPPVISLPAPYLSMLSPSSGMAGVRVNFQGSNITVNDRIEIIPPGQSYVTVDVVDPGFGFIFPTTIKYPCSNPSIDQNACASPVTPGNYGVRLRKPDGTGSNTLYFQVDNGTTGYNGVSVVTAGAPFSLTASSLMPNSVVLTWYNTTGIYSFKVVEVLPNNQSSVISVTSNKTLQVSNLVPNSTHTYVVYACVTSDCSQVSVVSAPVVVTTPTNAYGYNYGYNNVVTSAISSTATTQATNITPNSATVNGTVNLTNTSGDTVWTWFEYGTDVTNANTVMRTNKTNNTFQAGIIPVSAPVTYLQPGTVYQYRLVASLSTGTPVYSPINTFTTSAYYSY